LADVYAILSSRIKAITTLCRKALDVKKSSRIDKNCVKNLPLLALSDMVPHPMGILVHFRFRKA
jgi:hypothetical protein